MGKQCWKVVGGGDKGGVLVRAGKETSSEQLDRLATGAVVEEIELAGDRLNYKKLSGSGPEVGWVSIALKDKELLVKVDSPGGSGAGSAAPAAAPAEAGPAPHLLPVKQGDYYVTLGVLYKKPGEDPTTTKMLKLTRKVGQIVHTTGKVWRAPAGGYWVELNTADGDSGAGEKPGYLCIDANGLGTPGPCLQIANKDDGFPMLLHASKPPNDGKPWDGGSNEKEFLVLDKTPVSEIKIVLATLFGLEKDVKNYTTPITITAPKGGSLKDDTTAKDAGFKDGDEVKFEYSGPKPLNMVVMSPVEVGAKLLDLPIKDNWTVGMVKNYIVEKTGLKKGSMIMAKGKMGERIQDSDSSRLKEESLVVDYGYKEGDEIAFMYLGDPETDLKPFLSKK